MPDIKLQESQQEITLVNNENVLVVYHKDTNELDIITPLKINLKTIKDLSLDINGDLDISVHGQLNVNADQEIALDSNLPYETPSIFLNSKMAKQIINLPESIKQREDCKKKMEEMLASHEDCVHPHFDHDEEWWLKKFVQMMMEKEKGISDVKCLPSD